MKRLLLACCLFAAISSSAQPADEKAILQVLDEQNQAWNQGNIEEFMQGYWQNDSLMFIGKTGVTYGWNNTLNNYKTGYPDTAAMGKLKFTILSVKRLSDEYYFVVGKWELLRNIGNVAGHYTLFFRKINGKWLIIADHSS